MRTSSNGEFHLAATSVAEYLLKRMNLIHMDREMGAFAGPPGIGKTSMIELLKKEFPEEVVVVTPRQVGVKAIQGLVYTMTAVREHIASKFHFRPQSRMFVEAALNNALKGWVSARAEVIGQELTPNLTLVFDEAQRFDEAFFETIRSWNDAAGTDFLPPIGMIFVGNADFILENGTRGASFLSEAVLSRTTYSRTFEYKNLTDRDITLVLERNGVTDDECIQALLEHCGFTPRNRDLRVLVRLVRAAQREADGKQIEAEHVYRVLGLDGGRAGPRRSKRSPASRAA